MQEHTFYALKFSIYYNAYLVSVSPVPLGYQVESGKEGSKDGSASASGSGGKKSETVMLRWSTPKSMTLDLHYCSSVYRVTPADVCFSFSSLSLPPFHSLTHSVSVSLSLSLSGDKSSNYLFD